MISDLAQTRRMNVTFHSPGIPLFHYNNYIILSIFFSGMSHIFVRRKSFILYVFVTTELMSLLGLENRHGHCLVVLDVDG